MDLVTSHFLGHVAGRISSVQYSGNIAVGTGQHRYPDAHADRIGFAIPDKTIVPHAFAQFISNTPGLVDRAVFYQQSEFVASQPRQGIALTQLGLKHAPPSRAAIRRRRRARRCR